MYDGLIPQRYAMALYKYASEHHTQERVYDEMKTVADAFESNPDLRKVMSNPYIRKDDKKALLLAAAGPNVGDDYKSFVNLILNHKRESFAWQMALAYRRIYRKANKISVVNITTAVRLDDKENAKLEDLVRKVYSDRTLEISISVDPEIIGGFIIDVDNNRLNASVSNELETLRHNLISNN